MARDDDRARCDARFLCGRPVAGRRRPRRDPRSLRRQPDRPRRARPPRARRGRHCRRRQGFRHHAPPPRLRAPARSPPDRRLHDGAQRGIRPHSGAGSRQAHQGRAHRSRARHLHLQRRRRRKHPHLRRISSSRLAGIHRRTLGHRAPLPARPHRRHHAI